MRTEIRWPFVRRSKVEAALQSLRDMRSDYQTKVESDQALGNQDPISHYCKGKRDAYVRAVQVLRRAVED